MVSKLRNYFLHNFVYFEEFESADFKYFKMIAQKYQNKPFLVPNSKLFLLHEALYFEKLDSVGATYDDSFSNCGS